MNFVSKYLNKKRNKERKRYIQELKLLLKRDINIGLVQRKVYLCGDVSSIRIIRSYFVDILITMQDGYTIDVFESFDDDAWERAGTGLIERLEELIKGL